MRKKKSFISILTFIVTFAILDRLLEIILKPFLHRKRNKIIRQAVDRFQIICDLLSISIDENTIAKLTENLEAEAFRVYPIVERSILRERIIRSKYTFFATALMATILIGSLGGFKGGTILPFISPIVMAIVAWVTSILTIGVSYNQRVKGGMDSVIVREINLLKKASLNSNTLINEHLAATNSPELNDADSNQQVQVVEASVPPPVDNPPPFDAALSQMEEGHASCANIEPAPSLH